MAVHLLLYDLSHTPTSLPTGCASVRRALSHSSIMVYDKEIEYGPNGVIVTPDGVNAPKTKHFLAHTRFSEEEILNIVNQLKIKFTARNYDLMTRNCHTFCQEFGDRILTEKLSEHLINAPKHIYDIIAKLFPLALAGANLYSSRSPQAVVTNAMGSSRIMSEVWREVNQPEYEGEYVGRKDPKEEKRRSFEKTEHNGFGPTEYSSFEQSEEWEQSPKGNKPEFGLRQNVYLILYDSPNTSPSKRKKCNASSFLSHSSILVYGRKFEYHKNDVIVTPKTSENINGDVIPLGPTFLTENQLIARVNQIRIHFRSGNMAERNKNCHNFCHALAKEILKKTMPYILFKLPQNTLKTVRKRFPIYPHLANTYKAPQSSVDWERLNAAEIEEREKAEDKTNIHNCRDNDVYILLSSINQSGINLLFSNDVGHSAVYVYGRIIDFSTIGVHYDKLNVDKTKFIKINYLGETKYTESYIIKCIEKLKKDFTRESYNVVDKNCHKFSNALVQKILKKDIPDDYVKMTTNIAERIGNIVIGVAATAATATVGAAVLGTAMLIAKSER